MIPRIPAILRFGRVPVPHTNEAVYCSEARHGRNLLLVADEAGGSTAIAIDADEALIGHPAELERRGLVPPDPRILAHGSPPPGLRDAALRHADRCAALDPAALAADAAEACDVARESEVERLTRVLAGRCAAARALTTSYFDLVELRQ